MTHSFFVLFNDNWFANIREQLTRNWSLKRTGYFLKLCLLEVCPALIIPRFTLLIKTVFRPKNAFICLCQHMPLFQMFFKEQTYHFFCQRRHVYASTDYISCLFGCKPTKRVGIQNVHYSRFAGHKFYVQNTGKPICLHSICQSINSAVCLSVKS